MELFGYMGAYSYGKKWSRSTCLFSSFPSFFVEGKNTVHCCKNEGFSLYPAIFSLYQA